MNNREKSIIYELLLKKKLRVQQKKKNIDKLLILKAKKMIYRVAVHTFRRI